jgi:serine/threonine-protein kinase
MLGPDDPPDLGLKPGDVVAGKYRVERVLGAGGMGIVLAAYHLQLDERVALKFLRPRTRSDPSAITRFVREARATVKIKSEHVARVLDVGQLDGGVPYIVMEYLEGRDLADWLNQSGRLAPELAVELLLQACEAMAEAHTLGIVHRDLKPSNLFCVRRADGRPQVKVLDFGISKMSSAPGRQSVTRTDTVAGSPDYMSPEQMQAFRDIDARTDIWSLGVILFELLSGRVPFEGEVATDLAIKIATQPPLSLRSICPSVPPDLERVILRCLEKDRDCRFADVGALARALEPFAPARARGSVERAAATVEAGSAPCAASMPEFLVGPHTPATAPGTLIATMATSRRTRARSRKRARNAALGVGAGLGVLAALVAVLDWRRVPDVTASGRSNLAPASTSSAAPAALPSVSPAASEALTDAAAPPTVSPWDLPVAPATASLPPHLLPSRPTSTAHPSTAPPSAVAPPSPSPKPSYNPMEHL